MLAAEVLDELAGLFARPNIKGVGARGNNTEIGAFCSSDDAGDICAGRVDDRKGHALLLKCGENFLQLRGHNSLYRNVLFTTGF